jgi:hypothetical protein
VSARRTSAAGTPAALATGVGHDARERALAQVAEQQPDQERLLVGVGAHEQRTERVAPPALGARSGEPADRGERLLDLGHRQGGLRRGRRSVAQHRPADADLALGQLAREPADDGRHLAGSRAGEQLGERGDLRRARPRGGDGRRGVDERAEPQGRQRSGRSG